MTRYIFTISLLATLLGLWPSVQARQADSLEIEEGKEEPLILEKPTKAALMSAVLPGAGQAFNKKYWKIPIIYAGAVGFGIAIRYNHDIYVDFRNALRINTDGDPNTENGFPYSLYDNSGLQRVRDNARRMRDMSIILAGVFYGLNIADAAVDAHLKGFDVDEDLSSWRLQPVWLATPNARACMGLQLRYRF